MKPRQPHPRRRPIAEMNLIPYIDVMLVLLVIFMVATPLIMQGIQVTLPEATSPTLKPKDNKPLIVSINANGQYYINLSPHPRGPNCGKPAGGYTAPADYKEKTGTS